MSVSAVTTGSICFGSPTMIAFLHLNIAPTAICGCACPASSTIRVPSTPLFFTSPRKVCADANVVDITGVSRKMLWSIYGMASSLSASFILSPQSSNTFHAIIRLMILCLMHFEEMTNSLCSLHAYRNNFSRSLLYWAVNHGLVICAFVDSLSSSDT